jgi:hypothetical protein
MSRKRADPARRDARRHGSDERSAGQRRDPPRPARPARPWPRHCQHRSAWRLRHRHRTKTSRFKKVPRTMKITRPGSRISFKVGRMKWESDRRTSVGLPARQRRALDRIGDSLEGSDPRLAKMFAIFGRLTRDEEIPRKEELPHRMAIMFLRIRLWMASGRGRVRGRMPARVRGRSARGARSGAR